MRALLLAADDASGLPLYAYVIWTAFIIYVVWYVVRLYRKSVEKKAARAATPRPAAERPGPENARSASSPSPYAAPSTPSAPTPAAPTPRSATAGDPPPRSDDAGSRSGFFAAAGAEAARPTDRARRPVAAIVRGIAMPDALAPVINTDNNDLSGLRVAFSATGVDPGHVGRAVGDELERLGFSLRSLGDTQLGAKRDDDELVVTIYTDPAAVERLGSKAFPLLPPGTFVVEFESV